MYKRQALLTSSAFNHRGVRAAAVSGAMPLDERRLLLRRFDRGELDVIVNCMVLTEGYDAPRVDCIVVARPTKSRALYTQMVGRGTRRHPDKTDCLVLDVVGASAEHSLVTIPSLFGTDDVRLRERLESDQRGVAAVLAEYEAQEVAAGRLRAKDVELFAQVRRQLAWVEARRPGDDRRRYALGISRDEALVMVQLDPTDDGSWAVQRQSTGRGKAAIQARTLIRGVHLELAEGVAEDYARRFGRAHLVNPDAPWRKGPASEKQRAAARKWHLDPDKYANAGELSDAIAARIERAKAVRR